MRLLGATVNGWLADRVGRKTPLMISIAWYSVCNFIAGLAPSFFVLFLFRALLGSGWAPSGLPGLPSQWRPGRCVHAPSWAQ
jgi:MFS transporter, SHS family, lactate transporter